MTEPLIKRIDEFYVGFKNQHPNDSSLPLAFLTPFDTTKAFEKRKNTVDTWAQGYSKQTPPPAQRIKNEPLAGFKLAKSVKRTGSWNGGNVVWRIEDPRGFEWEIPSENMAQIVIQSGVAAGGEFNGRCIIGRMGASNILIPEGTDLWAQMEADMNTRKTRDSAKILTNLIPGDAITLKNGETGFYLGKRKVNLKIPTDKQLHERVGESMYRYTYKGAYHTEESKGEYHLVISGLTDYNYREAYYRVDVTKGNPQVVEVDRDAGISMVHIEKILRAPKCYAIFAGKVSEDSQEIVNII